MTQSGGLISTQAADINSGSRIIGALGYTSEILWHFFGKGRSGPDRINLLELILESGKLMIQPPTWQETVVTMSPAEQEMDPDRPPQLQSSFFAEPKMVCFADIPIHCLPIHSQRYGHFALGFSLSGPSG